MRHILILIVINHTRGNDVNAVQCNRTDNRYSEMTSHQVGVLGNDPVNRKNRLNGVSYQEDALTSYNGWQYAIFYASTSGSAEPLYVHLARRSHSQQDWTIFRFEDYEQVTDDGHNTAQLGICRGDGSIHLSYDHHCDTCVVFLLLKAETDRID